MKAAVLYSTDDPPQYDEFPNPELQADERLIIVKAASLKNIDKMRASGKHYDTYSQFPAIPGVDGVGELEDGTLVYCGNVRAPYGMMAEFAALRQGWFRPIPAGLDAVTAAALPNPALSSWLPMAWRAKLEPGETVLILGATGTSGRLAVQIAKHLGAGRVIAAGRNMESLEELKTIGADETISLATSDKELTKAFRENLPYNVVLDFVYGHPAEVLIASLTGHDLTAEPVRTRYVHIGGMAGPTITLPGAALRSTALEIYGSGGGSVPPALVWQYLGEMYELAAKGGLTIHTEAVPLADVESTWNRPTPGGKRFVFVT